MSSLKFLGIDLAKEIFQLHGMDAKGKTLFQKQVKRDKLMATIANLPSCLIGMEACSGAHFWAREFEKLGHKARIMAGHLVKPYVKGQKNDAHDAAAIAEALSRPEMRFVPIKELWQQEIQTLLRVRENMVSCRRNITNSIHGLLAEYGIVLPKTDSRFIGQLGTLLKDENSPLGSIGKSAIEKYYNEWNHLTCVILELAKQIETVTKENEVCKRIQTIPGVGPQTAAAVVASTATGNEFKNGRQFAAFLGLVPRQFSSGGKVRLGRITKRGDAHIRTLLVLGAQSVIRYSGKREDRLNKWIYAKVKSKNRKVVAVAIANKNARIIWALLKNQQEYKDYSAVTAA